MKDKVQFVYDGSFEGFLTCVFVSFEEKVTVVSIEKTTLYTPQLFYKTQFIHTELKKAERVWSAYASKKQCLRGSALFAAFLSEIKGTELQLLHYLHSIFNTSGHGQNYSETVVLTISQIAKMVYREKHRMEAFVRFEKMKDHIYFAKIAPDFNVLPLIIKHFTNRYADQKWLIYDTKRNYGSYYDLKNTQFITFELPKTLKNTLKLTNHSPEEINYQKLWSTYFSSVNIRSRKNAILHKQHIPTRYWKYLTEKFVIK